MCSVRGTRSHTQLTKSHTYTRAMHTKHSSCQSRVQPHRLLLSTQSGYLPLCTVSYSNKHPRHSDPDTFLPHTHTHSQTHLGTMHVSGVSNGQRLQSTYSFSFKRKRTTKKDRTVHIERGDFLNFFLHKKSGWRRRDWAWLEDYFILLLKPSAYYRRRATLRGERFFHDCRERVQKGVIAASEALLSLCFFFYIKNGKIMIAINNAL